MKLIFIFTVILIEILLVYFLQIVEIIRTFRIHAFMDPKKFTVFLSHEGIAAVRTGETKWSGNIFAGREGLSTDLTLKLTIAAIVIVNVMMRRTTKRAYSVFWNGFTVTALNRFYRFTILPLIVFKKELPVLFDKGLDDRKLVNLKFLILGRVRIIKSPLFKRNISADKVNKPANLLMLVLNKLK